MKVASKSVVNSRGILDVNAAGEIFKTAHDFITKVWKMLPLQNMETEETDEAEQLDNSTKRVKTKSFGKGTRAKSLEELHKRLDELKGKRKGYKDKLHKKGLKNRLIKKKKIEERRLRKNLINKQRAGPEFESIAENFPSKPSRPIYNSEGKVVFSKFDFSESSSSSTTDILRHSQISKPKLV